MSGDPIVPESEHQGLIDAVDHVLKPLNVPNKVSRWRVVTGMIPALLFILLGVVVSIAIYFHRSSINGHPVKGHQLKGALIVLGAMGGFGIVLGVIPGLIAYKQLKKFAKTPPPTYTHFQTGAATSYQLPLNLKSAVIGYDESIGSWFGPVTNPGFSGSYGVLAREVDKEAVNTLLFTGSQVIGLMLGPDDLRNLRGSWAIKSAANEVLKYNSSSGYKKGVQFQALNANHWDQMVDALSAEPLEAALANHLNFGLPYEGIESVEVHAHMVNPGITFHLKDGKHIRYATFSKNRLPEVTTYLKQFVTVTQ